MVKIKIKSIKKNIYFNPKKKYISTGALHLAKLHLASGVL